MNTSFTERVEALDPLLGTVLQDRYRIVSRLGEGGMSVVYVVEHTLIGRRLALKVLDPSLANNANAISRFYREARAAAAIDDEQIVEVVDVGKLDNGSPYMLMELLNGRDLRKELEATGPMTIERAVAIAIHCCRALGKAHRKGVVHRDIKPENVFITQRSDGSELIKILDFGVSKMVESGTDLKNGSLTRTGTAIGTPHYMSPEQINGTRDIDPRADIYAMGVVLFEMLANRIPFEATNYPLLVMKIMNEQPPSLMGLRSDIPPELDQVVQRALSRKRDARFSSMADFAEALAPFSNSSVPQLTQSGVVLRETPWPPVWERSASRASPSFLRNSLLFSGALAGGAIIAIIVLFFINGYGSNHNLVKPIAPSEPTVSSESQPNPSTNASPSPESRIEARSPTVPIERSEPTAPENIAESFEKKARFKAPSSSEKQSQPTLRETRKRQASRGQRNISGNISTNFGSPGQSLKSSPERKSEASTGRSVTLRNSLRSNVKVTFRCGSSSSTASVTAMSDLSTVLPRESCEVSCSGVGRPVCPARLDAADNGFDIR
ncbi:MAG: protein kinase [Deltaproteobacteria bacterium]|nr:protein kinase [Deltaproteobacteria bacterium]